MRITQKSKMINGKMNSDHMKGSGVKDAATPYHVRQKEMKINRIERHTLGVKYNKRDYAY